MKALALFSGGLDSLLAIKLIQDQNIQVKAINFTTPFFSNKKAIEQAKLYNIDLISIDITKDYLKMLKKPKHGYGKNINPCIDCKIFMLKQAKKYAKKINANFIFTGEVLGERPMSQNKPTLFVIEKEAGLKNRLLRPLSAKLLPKTIIEKKKLVDISKLLNIQGRSRKIQLELVKKYNIKEFATPAGGCLLTDSQFAKKLIDLIKYKKNINNNDLEILKLGRHFRYKTSKIIVGRNYNENQKLLKLKNNKDIILEVIDEPSPITILQNTINKEAIKIAASLTARYSDSKKELVPVKYNEKIINVKKIDENLLNNLRI
ncbi:MAG: tRNA 4-thiouridine(8) synthase ThiI [Candidatus Woesearchaeota archaeon]